MATIGRNIKYYRKLRRMSQTELALKTGYTNASMISRIERGAVQVNEKKARIFADVLGVNIEDLIEPDAPIGRSDLDSVKVNLDGVQKYLADLASSLGLSGNVEKRLAIWEAYEEAPKEIQSAVDRLLNI